MGTLNDTQTQSAQPRAGLLSLSLPALMASPPWDSLTSASSTPCAGHPADPGGQAWEERDCHIGFLCLSHIEITSQFFKELISLALTVCLLKVHLGALDSTSTPSLPGFAVCLWFILLYAFITRNILCILFISLSISPCLTNKRTEVAGGSQASCGFFCLLRIFRTFAVPGML